MSDLTATFNIVTSIGAVTVPVASTIMAMDTFVLPRFFGLRRPMHRVAAWNELALANWPAIVALVAGTGLGAYTAGLIPALSTAYIGFPAVQAWITAAVVYLLLVALVAGSPRATEILGYARIGDSPPVAEPQPVSSPAYPDSSRRVRSATIGSAR